MRAYCAGSWQNRETVDYRARILNRRAGWIITSRWHRTDDQALSHDPAVFAPADIADMEKAKRLVWFGDDPVSPGKHFELGFACARRWPIYIVGEHKQRCGFIPPNVQFTWDEFIEAAEHGKLQDEVMIANWREFLQC